jgi:DNA-binding transcriptional ArsR family regulator
VKSAAPPLLPLLRSRLEGELLAEILLHPDREFGASELAERYGASLPTVVRELDRLAESGVVRSRKVGRVRLVQADPSSRATAPLTQLAALTFGPITVIADEFGNLAGVDGVYIFGSWAARYDGETGAPPNDVDVLVVGRPDREQMYAAADAAALRLGREVNPTVRSLEAFDGAGDGFVAQLKSRPLIEVWPAAQQRAS